MTHWTAPSPAPPGPSGLSGADAGSAFRASQRAHSARAARWFSRPSWTSAGKSRLISLFSCKLHLYHSHFQQQLPCLCLPCAPRPSLGSDHSQAITKSKFSLLAKERCCGVPKGPLWDTACAWAREGLYLSVVTLRE